MKRKSSSKKSSRKKAVKKTITKKKSPAKKVGVKKSQPAAAAAKKSASLPPRPVELQTEDSTASEILRRIRDALTPIKLNLTNLSAAHFGHKEAKKQGGGHYQLSVVSDVFAGLSLQQRQQWVMGLVRDLFGKAIHALQLDLKEPAEEPLKAEVKGTLVQSMIRKRPVPDKT